MNWYVYIVKCADGSLYTGITKDLDRRVEEHNSDNRLGSKYLRYRRPGVLVYYEEFKNRAEAAKRESSIKKLTRQNKLKLVEENF